MLRSLIQGFVTRVTPCKSNKVQVQVKFSFQSSGAGECEAMFRLF